MVARNEKGHQKLVPSLPTVCYKECWKTNPCEWTFDRVGVDMMQFPKSRQGNRYAIVPSWTISRNGLKSSQSSQCRTRLLLEEIVCRHGVPNELLSD